MDIWIYDDETVRNVEHFEGEDGVPFTDWLELPEWVESGHFDTPDDLAAVVQGGCASGAYMPAVRYSTARSTMGEYGDDVLAFTQDCGYSLSYDDIDESWSAFCCYVLSVAVEAWAFCRLQELCSMEDPNEMLEGVRDYV